MSWYYNWSDGIKKRVCRYLLQRYLGQFLEEKLTLDQLSVDIYSGTGSVSDVSLDVQALNELGEQKNIPIEFVDGYISQISVSIPWATLLTDSIFIEVSGLQLTIQPRQRSENGESMLESMWSSVASSMQLAAECLKQESTTEDDKASEAEHQMEGLEIFAQTIESVLTRVKMKFLDTTLRLEHLPKEGKNGIAVEIRTKTIEYCDETSCEDICPGDIADSDQAAPLFTIKKFHCDGVSFYTDEFPCESRTFSRSVLEDLPQSLEREKSPLTPILIGKLSGIQEVRLKSKKMENVSQGPKFELEFSLGSLSLFISPRQLYLLIEMMHSLSAPHTQDTSNVKYKKTGEKLLNSNDYRKIEQDLHDTLYSQGFSANTSKNILGKGWVSTSMEESDDEFFPFGRRGSQSASLYSNNTDISWETSASTILSNKGDFLHSYSSSTEGPVSNKRYEKGNIFDVDLNGETISFHVRLSNIAIVILHEDILTFSVDSYVLTPSSVSTMNNLSNRFFEQLGKFGISGFGNKDFETFKAAFQNACDLDHIRIMAAAVIVEGKEGGSNSNKFCNTKISAASFELLECLFEPNTKEPEYVELLKFMKSGQPTPIKPHFSFTNQPDVRIMISQSKKTRPSHVFTKTEITFYLQQCWSELDLSLYDRLSTIFKHQTLCLTDLISKGSKKQSPFCEAYENAIVTDHSLLLKVACPFLVIKFRFPIPDMRPDIEKGRHPWWKRSIRKDLLFITFVDPIFHTEVNYHGAFLDYNLQCNQISLLFQVGDCDVPTPFLYSSPVDSNYCNQKAYYEKPTFSIKLSSPKAIDDIEDVQEKEEATGLTCSFMETPLNEPSPFASKRFVYKSDSASSSACEGEEVIMPASKEDINTFINDALLSSKIQVRITLPYVHVNFSSKHLFEVLFNRFCSDVSLWKSSASKITPMNLHSSNLENIFPKCSSFSMCKSGLHLGDMESEEENENGENIYSKILGQSGHNLYCKNTHQSRFALQIHFNSGHLTICPNLKDSSGNIVPEKHGQLQFSLEKANIFSVSSFKGVSQKNYLCFLVENISVCHKAIINNSDGSGSLNQNSFNRRSKLLKPILYKTNSSMSAVNKADMLQADKPDMLTVALSSSVDSRRIKTMKVSCSIKGATLSHYVTPSEHSWLMQLKDFFDVVVYPVKGYDSPQAITELYFNVEDSLIDYRPVHLRTKCVLYLGNFSVSSNIAARTKTSSLRFIAEETNLFISNKPSKITDDVNLRNDYVSVIDLGMFELSLRLSNQPNLPKVDLKASSDIFNIRTCSDSASSLAELIKYYASKGDLNIPVKVEDTKSSEPYLEKNVDTKNSDPLTLNSKGEVYDMMEDAMKEFTTNDDNVKSSHTEENDEVEVFYFPDEGKKDDNIDQAYDWAAGDFDSDSDFCILENEPLSPFLPEGTHPVVQTLTDRPIQIIENHFNVSIGKTDFLLPPKYYPSPVYRYTLSDMNLVWHMFGGKDFSDSPAPKKNLSFDFKEKTVGFKMNLNAEHDNLVYHELHVAGKNDDLSNRKKKDDSKHKRSYRSNKWFIVGGSGRKHDVLMQLHFSKVRFQHEIYPENTTQASRQVLLIHNFEIRDKLSTSPINKFLYQYTSETSPRQANANMFMVKAVHLRPDTRMNVQETCLKISMLPLRLNIDQDSLEFLYCFFSQLSTKSEENVESQNSVHQRKDNPENIGPENPPSSFETESEKLKNTKSTSKSSSSRSSLYIKNFVFSPDVPIRIDYEGKRVNMTHGPMAGIIMGIGQLNCLQITLKRLSHKHGLLGWDKLLSFAFSEWLHDIKKTQFPCLIGGVGPMHALVQLFLGIKDLFWLPIEQYQKDGRIFRGIQRGANSFTTSTVIAALELTARIVQVIQSIAEAAFDMVSPGPSVRRIHGNKAKKQHKYSHPADIREGVTNAYALVKEGLEETAETLVRVASSEAEQKGAVGAVGGVLRQIPPSMVAPIIIASAATSNLLGGVRNQLAPDSRREASLKWKANET